MTREIVTIDGNEAAAFVAYRASEVIAIYPITPSSGMGEFADAWSASGVPNAWGTVPFVQEMQSEGGAAGAVHGALQTGALCTTFTASQGLLLMVPNMYKIAGELTPTVFHVAARALAAQALSIFGDHSDVMAARTTGWAMLCSNSVQEVMDLALVAHAATLKARVPFMHFFDGFRTSHEVMKIEQLGDDDIRALLDDDLVRAHRARALSPDRPFIRGTAQDPDVCFQARETANPFYAVTPGIVQESMDALAARVGRQNRLFDYVGAPFAMPRVIGGRYGLASKEFTPAMVKAVFDELNQARPKNHFAVGIVDDITGNSLELDPDFDIEAPGTVRALFYGLGADGTVGANKNSIKIIGEETPNHAQGYFVYDSKKSGSRTVSHLRFGPERIRDTYLIGKANFIACHQWGFLERFDILKGATPGAVFLLNSVYGPDEVWAHLPQLVQEQIVTKGLRFFVIDGYKVAKDAGMGGRVNTIMQTAFFAISGVLPRDEAIAEIKHSIEKTYGKRGEAVVQQNFAAVDMTLANLHEVAVPDAVSSAIAMRPAVPAAAPEFVRAVTARIIAGEGNSLPVSALPVDGTYPSATSQWEKRNISLEIPVWDPDVCIQCGKCVLVCPHAVIRAKVYDEAALAGAPPTFKSAPARWVEFKERKYTLQVAPEDCTGCTLCVEVCPAKNKSNTSLRAINMASQLPLREPESANWEFFLGLPETDRATLSPLAVKDAQLLRPLFEFSGACAGCGETPYLKLVSQLFGDRAIIANATGCSSIYGGNLPTTPWAHNAAGRGPAWSNSLFEDNAEFGLGFRMSLDKQNEYARELVGRLSGAIGADLATELLAADMTAEAGIEAQRERVAALKARLSGIDGPAARDLLALADVLVRRSVWIVGGDGWAYDIGYGGLDHVLAVGRDVNVLVLDTEVYSNTGGQASKSTPRAAVAKFAAGGKPTPKKDLARLAMTYGNVYVARVAMGANDAQTMRAFVEAESYPGPSLIIAYSHCIAHGINMAKGLEQQKLAVQTGYWPLLRYDPRLEAAGGNPFVLDSRPPSLPVDRYMYNETRFKMLTQSNPVVARQLLALAQEDVNRRWTIYQDLAGHRPETAGTPAPAAS